MGKLDKILLSRAILTKTVLGAAAAAALTTGTVLGVSSYRSGNHFHPSDTERGFNANQVHFDDDQDVKGSDSTAEKDDSELWEQDSGADDTSGPQNDSHADFMFQRKRMQENFSDPLSVAGGTADTSMTAGGSGDTVYNVTNDRGSADVIIGGRPGGTTAVVPGNGGAGTGENPGGNSGAATPAKPDTPNTPGEPSAPSRPGNHDKPSKPDGGSSDNMNGGGTAAPPSVQGGSIANTVQDPDSGKTSAGLVGENDQTSTPYYEGQVKDSTAAEVVIQQPQNSSGDADPSALYAGQKNITARKVYNALETYVYVNENGGNFYYWSNLKDANGNDVHFGVFVRINGIWIGDTFFSFFNEATGEYDKTLDEIPSDATEIKISASYRLSAGSAWKDYADITYTLERNRIFILNRRLTENDKNTQFDNNILLNPYTDTSFDPDDESAVIDLYGYQRGLLGEERLSALFPGWQENGRLIPWMYHPAAGRHVIEPADMIPLPDNYTVQVKIRWYDTDTGAVTRSWGDAENGLAAAFLDETEPDLSVSAPQFSTTQKSVYMQTLTGYEGDPGSVLEVPEYVQAVDMGTENTLHEVDYIKIPDTVQYVNTKNYSEQPEGTQTAVKGITVKKGYIVDADSTAYAATADGILTNADGSAYLGIPYDMTELTVPENVEKVTLPNATQVTRLVLQAEAACDLPEIDFGGMDSGVIVVKPDAYHAFMSSNETALDGTSTRVASSDGRWEAYDGAYLENDTASKAKTLTRVQAQTGYYTLPSGVNAIGPEAFADAENVKNVVLPMGRDQITIAPDSFKNSNVDTILCPLKAQAEDVQAQLYAAGITEVRAIVLETNSRGETYYTDERSAEVVLMVGDPDATAFNGTIQAADGNTLSVTTLADGAFAGSQKLQWALLPESLTNIGAQAFYGCSNLEGIMIDAKKEASVGNAAFDNCTSLNFIASNAPSINMGGYSVSTGAAATVMYSPTRGIGYGEDWTYFDERSGVQRYDVVDIGSTKMLYGARDGQDWLGLRAGGHTEGELALPEETIELFNKAFYGNEGPFTINWSKLPDLQYIDNYAFAGSGLEGEVDTAVSLVGEAAFQSTNITKLVLNGYIQRLDMNSFVDCRSLTSVSITRGFEHNGSIYAGLFSECSALEDITIADFGNVPQLLTFSAFSAFTFNYEWTWQDTLQRVHIVSAWETGDELAPSYVKKWRYPLLGSMDVPYATGYMNLWDNTMVDLMFSGTWEDLYAETDAVVKQKLVDIENDIRTMPGAETKVEEPSEFYPYRVRGNDITLIGAPSNKTTIDLNNETLGLLDGWCLDYIGEGAFSNTKNLEYLILESGLAGIEQDAFRGVESDTLTMTFMDGNPPELLNFTSGEGYSFGIDESRIKIYILAWGDEEAYLRFIKKWIYPMAGYADYAEMYAAVAAGMPNAAEEEIHAKMEEILLPVENRIRRMLWHREWIPGASEFEESTTVDTHYPEVDKLSFELAPKKQEPEMVEPDDQNRNPDEKDDLTPAPEPNPGTNTDTSNGNTGEPPTTDGDAANEPAGDSTGKDNGSADTAAGDATVLPMPDGKHEIVIPSGPPESTSTEDNSTSAEDEGETE